MLVLTAPLFPIIAAAIRLESPGPVFFSQIRAGGVQSPRGRAEPTAFRMWKFRSMRNDAEKGRAQFAAHNDPRVTRVGRFLRKSRLDELPQFWNVLRGDMSLVGPRPVVEEELAHYGAARDLLLTVRPGITGAWAVSGRSKIGYPERAGIELEYVHSWTTRVDLAILLRTFGVVLQRRGAL